jgi:hypothetical protein
MIQDWWECQRYFQFKYVEKLIPPDGLSAEQIDSICMHRIMLLWAKNKRDKANIDIDKMTQELLSEYERMQPAMRKAGKRSGAFDRRLGAAMMMISEWDRRHGMTVRPEAIFEKKSVKMGKHELVVCPDVIDGSMIGVFRVAGWRWSWNASNSWPLVQMQCLVTGLCNYWVAQFCWKNPAWVLIHHVSMEDSQTKWLQYCLPRIAEAMEHGPYMPCLPASFKCNKKQCEYFTACRAEALAEGVASAHA